MRRLERAKRKEVYASCQTRRDRAFGEEARRIDLGWTNPLDRAMPMRPLGESIGPRPFSLRLCLRRHSLSAIPSLPLFFPLPALGLFSRITSPPSSFPHLPPLPLFPLPSRWRAPSPFPRIEGLFLPLSGSLAHDPSSFGTSNACSSFSSSLCRRSNSTARISP